jgi:uncharacterized DUF497 family protein
MAEIEFDPNKDESNLRKHGIRLARASDFRPVAVLEDTRKNYGETRYRGFGFIDGKPYALAFTVRGSRADRKVRPISLRHATEKEIKSYGLQKARRS